MTLEPGRSTDVALPSRAATLSDTRAAARARPDAKLLALLAVGHLVIDANQGALPAFLPFLREAFNLSYAAAGTIVLAGNLTSSVIQPLFGYLSDQTARRWLLPISVLVSGFGLALTGVAPSYAAILVLVVVTGLGVAAYHPEGYRTASHLAGDRKATGLSFFSIGGNVGIALGPPMITALVAGFGLWGSLGMLIPAVVVGGLLTVALPVLSAETPRPASVAADGRKTMLGAMALLILVVMLRSWTQLGLTTYIPFFYIDVLKADPRIVGPCSSCSSGQAPSAPSLGARWLIAGAPAGSW